eukprot:2071037-Ditylum_brightwellii.AAC.1
MSCRAYFLRNATIILCANPLGHSVVMVAYTMPMSNLLVNAMVKLAIAMAFDFFAFFVAAAATRPVSSITVASVAGRSGST